MLVLCCKIAFCAYKSHNSTISRPLCIISQQVWQTINLGKAHLYMGEYFNPVSDVHQYSTRFRVKSYPNGSDCSTVHLVKSKIYSFTVVKGLVNKIHLLLIGCCLWKYLPQNIRDTHTIFSFKSNLKHHLTDLVYIELSHQCINLWLIPDRKILLYYIIRI